MKVFKENRELNAEELNEEQIEALSNEIRQRIMIGAAEEPTYPSEAARKYGLSKQRAHYHFKKLEEAELLVKTGEEEKSGGTATLYTTSSDVYVFDTGAEGREAFTPGKTEAVEEFLKPLVENGRIKGKIVAGSAEQHGPDQVRARDGHLGAEIAGKLGNYGNYGSKAVVLDTELSRDKAYEQNLFILGGVLTNTAAKKFNEEFPAKFTGDEFPYREISTPENSYTEPNIGLIAKAENPEDKDKAVYMVAGVRNRGTEAGALAFHELEEVADKLVENGYVIVRGLDENGDGKIDSYEVVE